MTKEQQERYNRNIAKLKEVLDKYTIYKDKQGNYKLEEV